ncbi:unnamed protein product [Phytomonas sp. Hart1]|nr:unnamed protein product [Phytomonas sp. Hart1]|eukprot:CCW68029.1 unnamed protein product [Phytomonas sp. isolate Hart1]
MSVRMDASLYSKVARIEVGDFLHFRCEELSHHQKDVQRYFFGVYYPRWHAFYLEEVRSIIGNMGRTVLKHFPTFPLDVYTNEKGNTYLTDDFYVGNILLLGSPHNQRDDDIKRYKIISIDNSNLRSHTGRMPKFLNSSVDNPSTMLLSTGKRVPVRLPEEIRTILSQLREAYIANIGGSIPEIGIKAMGRPFRKVSADGRRWMKLSPGIETLVRDSHAFGVNPFASSRHSWSSTALSNSTRSQNDIRSVAEAIYNAFPHDEVDNFGESKGVDYDVFMDYIRGTMNEARKKAVWMVFCQLDFDQDGQIAILDIQARFNAHEHPMVVRDGLFTATSLLKGFLALWDENQKHWGMIPYSEFLDYYNGLSSIIEEDDVFFSILKTTWKLPSWGKSLLALK